jgi:transposase
VEDVMGVPVQGVRFVGVDVAVNWFAAVAVGVGVEVPAPPANE